MFSEDVGMREVYTLETLNELPKDAPLYGVLGFPVQHSLSPQFQMAAFQKLGIPAHYVRIETSVEQLEEMVKQLKGIPFRGWNCTLPHKFEMLKFVDLLDDHARTLGAVNTVLNDHGKFIGFNTDGFGWLKAIREEFSADVRNLRIMILGIGGAGQALAIQAALERCERLVLVNRTFEKAQRLAKTLENYFRSEKLQGAQNRLLALPWNEEEIAQEIDHVDLVVNCTAIGWKPHEPSVLPLRALQPHLLVYDTIYKETKFLEAAREAGARCANGLSMLLHQGTLAFEIWTGKKAPVEIMRSALQQAVQS
ncbi:MAG: shikimate dehydrogenase [Verrucomicrobiota bacterium]